MTPPRFQFTIRNLLWVTFWVAVTFAAWPVYFRYFKPFGLSSDRWWIGRTTEVPGIVLMATYLLPIAGLISPCIAVGVLMGKPIQGIKAGLIVSGIVGVIVGMRALGE